MKKFSTIRLVRAGIVAGLYVVLSMLTLPISSGVIQFRLSECLTILPLVFPETIFGLFAGCMISNLITGCLVLDIILGSLITLVSAIFTYLFGRLIKNTTLKVIVGGLFPVLLNAFLLPVVWYYIYGELEYIYILQVTFLLVSQAVSIYGLGTPVYIFSNKYKLSKLK